jgi:hypothetical protein
MRTAIRTGLWAIVILGVAGMACSCRREGGTGGSAAGAETSAASPAKPPEETQPVAETRAMRDPRFVDPGEMAPFEAVGGPVLEGEDATLRWSEREVGTSPGGVKFRGEFCNDTVTILKTKLPEHAYLEITLDLLILKTWDGCEPNTSTRRTGPDYWSLVLDRERTLVYATFSNTPEAWPLGEDCKSQTYPSPVPGDRSDAKAGAAEKDTLGYFFPYGTSDFDHQKMDATYRLHFVLPHTGPEALLKMRGLGLQNMQDESWGVKDVRIVARSAKEVGTPKAADLERLFEKATGSDGVAANEAFWELVRVNEATVTYLAKAVKPVAIDRAGIKKLAAELYLDEPPKDERDPRVKAVIKTGFGSAMEPLIRDLMIEEREFYPRLEWVLIDLGIQKIDDPAVRRMVVATRILECIGTGEASDARTALFPQVTDAAGGR